MKFIRFSLFGFLVFLSFTASASHLRWDGTGGNPPGGLTSYDGTAATAAGTNDTIITDSAGIRFFESYSPDTGQSTNLFAGSRFLETSTTLATGNTINHEWTYYIGPQTGPGVIGGVNITWFGGWTSVLVSLDGGAFVSAVMDAVPGGDIWSFVIAGVMGTVGTEEAHTIRMRMVVGGVGAAVNYEINLGEVPIPAAVWLFGSALLGLTGLSSRRKSLPTDALAA